MIEYASAIYLHELWVSCKLPIFSTGNYINVTANAGWLTVCDIFNTGIYNNFYHRLSKTNVPTNFVSTVLFAYIHGYKKALDTFEGGANIGFVCRLQAIISLHSYALDKLVSISSQAVLPIAEGGIRAEEFQSPLQKRVCSPLMFS